MMWFQFHKGTIKTLISWVSALSKLEFQFHKGTIKTDHEDLDKFNEKISIP